MSLSAREPAKHQKDTSDDFLASKNLPCAIGSSLMPRTYRPSSALGVILVLIALYATWW